MILILLNIKKLKPIVSKKSIFFLLFVTIHVFVAFSKEVALYKWLKVAELIFIFMIVQATKLNPRTFLFVFLTSAVFELVLSMLQLEFGHTMQGFFYFFGERALTLSTPDVAKATVNGIEFLRPYGTFSHPNSLAGFYALVYVFFLTYQTPEKLLKYALLFTSLGLVLISFSKVAIVAVAVISLFYLFRERKNINCRVCIISRAITLVVLVALVFYTRGDPLTVQKRWVLIQDAFTIIAQHPLFGVGLGNFIIAEHQFPIYYSYFFLQPVHNIFLLMLSETGILIWFGLLPMLWKIVHKHIHNLTLILCLFLIVFTGFFDHYWYTLQQNWLLMGVIIAIATTNYGITARTRT